MSELAIQSCCTTYFTNENTHRNTLSPHELDYGRNRYGGHISVQALRILVNSCPYVVECYHQEFICKILHDILKYKVIYSGYPGSDADKNVYICGCIGFYMVFAGNFFINQVKLSDFL